MDNLPTELDGARGGGSGGRRARGRHPDQASGQPGAACATLGEQAPPPAAAILHSFGRAGFSGPGRRLSWRNGGATRGGMGTNFGRAPDVIGPDTGVKSRW